MRGIGIIILEAIKGLKFKSGTKYGIDLVLIDNPIIGAEGENGQWHGDRWSGGQADHFNLGFNTLNIQNRKWHYWNLQELSEKKGAKYWWGKFDLGYDKNFYFRLNKEEDQICIVDDQTILDDKKRRIVLDRKVSNNSDLEDWICIKQEFVETYNKQPNGEWVLNGKYWGPTQEECVKILQDEAILKSELITKRLKELYKSKNK